MRRLFQLILQLVLVTLLGCRAQPPALPAQPPALPAEPALELSATQMRQNAESFDKLWTTINDSYFAPDRLGPDGVNWPLVREELAPRVAAATSMDEARSLMGEAISRLGESHFAIMPADLYQSALPADASGGASGTGPTTALATRDGITGITPSIVADGVIVWKVLSGSPAEAAGIRPGWQIVRAGRRDLAVSLATLEADEGFAARSSAVQGLARQQVIEQLLSGKPGEFLEVELRDANDNRAVRSLRLVADPARMVTLGAFPPIPLKIETRTLPGGVGYFHLSAFFEPTEVMTRLRSFLAEHRTAPGIIIDLRGNPGGIGGMAMGISGHFIAERGRKLGTMNMKGTSLDFVVFPQALRVESPLAILVDGRSMSTSEILAGGLQDLGRARIFGQPTPGAALPSNAIALPNGDRLQYAVADYVSAGGQRLEGHGVIPDELVKLDRTSLSAGRDPVIEAALRWIATAPTVSAKPETQPATMPR